MEINRKGFTLIELLAVIIVLAVVTLLAVQAILPQVDKARKNAFVVEVNNAIEAAKQWYGIQVLEGTGQTCVSITTLKNEHYFEVSDTGYNGTVTVLIDSTTKVVTGYKISMTNGSYKILNHTGKLTTSQAATEVKLSSDSGTVPTSCS